MHSSHITEERPTDIESKNTMRTKALKAAKVALATLLVLLTFLVWFIVNGGFDRFH
jgi:hypothetical protein